MPEKTARRKTKTPDNTGIVKTEICVWQKVFLASRQVTGLIGIQITMQRAITGGGQAQSAVTTFPRYPPNYPYRQ